MSKKSYEIFKVQVFCPVKYAENLRLKIGDVGGGTIGNYSHCAFVSLGEGYFLPLKGAKPKIGKVGKIQKVKEVKIEFICEKKNLKSVLKTIKENHPYEEVPIDIIPLINKI